MRTDGTSHYADQISDVVTGDGNSESGDGMGGGWGGGFNVSTGAGSSGFGSGLGNGYRTGGGAGAGHATLILFNPSFGDLAAEVIYANVFGARA